MAITATALDSVMITRYQTGVTTSGSPIVRQKSFAVKATATHQDIADVAAALLSLSQHPLIERRRNDCFTLVEE